MSCDGPSEQPPRSYLESAKRAAGADADVLEPLPFGGPQHADKPTEESMDESLEETFPASDPPSFIANSGGRQFTGESHRLQDAGTAR
jgi:hypothetical protein